jgi:O-antigen/teichoic acid export membrane protein
MISKSFFKSSIVFTIGGSLPMLAGIILLPFYTNYLSEDNYTQVLFYISISLLFQILFSYSLESYFGIKYTQLSEEPHKQKKFVGTVSLLLIFIGIGLLFLSAISGDFLFRSIYRSDLNMEFWPYGFYSILTAFFNSYFKAATTCLIYLKQSKLFIITNFINFFITIFISIGGLYLFPNSIVGPMYGRLISGVAIFIMAYLIFNRNGVKKFDWSFIKELTTFCTPYVFYVICVWILGQIDRFILQSYIKNSDLNAYDLILKCFFGIEFVQNSLAAVIFPKLYEIWNKNKIHATTPESNRYFNVFTAINIVQLILFCVFIPIIFRLIVKNETFYQSEKYIGVLAAGYAIRSILIFYLATILFTKKIKVLLKIFVFSAVFQILFTLLAVKYFGLMGAIYAGLITKILQVVFCMIFTKPIFKYEFNYFKIVVIPITYVVVNLIQFFVFENYSVIPYLLQLPVFGLLLYFIFKNEIKKVLVSFKVIAEK